MLINHNNNNINHTNHINNNINYINTNIISYTLFTICLSSVQYYSLLIIHYLYITIHQLLQLFPVFKNYSCFFKTIHSVSRASIRQSFFFNSIHSIHTFLLYPPHSSPFSQIVALSQVGVDCDLTLGLD